ECCGDIEPPRVESQEERLAFSFLRAFGLALLGGRGFLYGLPFWRWVLFCSLGVFFCFCGGAFFFFGGGAFFWLFPVFRCRFGFLRCYGFLSWFCSRWFLPGRRGRFRLFWRFGLGRGLHCLNIGGSGVRR